MAKIARNTFAMTKNTMKFFCNGKKYQDNPLQWRKIPTNTFAMLRSTNKYLCNGEKYQEMFLQWRKIPKNTFAMALTSAAVMSIPHRTFFRSSACWFRFRLLPQFAKIHHYIMIIICHWWHLHHHHHHNRNLPVNFPSVCNFPEPLFLLKIAAKMIFLK